MSRDVVIASACRTAIGKFQGGLSSLPAPQLGAVCIREAIRRAGIEPDALRRLVEGLAAAGQLRQHWTVDDAVDALAVLTSYATYERLRRADRSPEQVEAVLAKLAISIVAPGTGTNSTGAAAPASK